MSAKQRIVAFAREQPDDLAANGVAAIRISLRAAVSEQKITPTDREAGECWILALPVTVGALDKLIGRWPG
jgi:hypothetical protein